MMNCETALELLSASLDGELTAEEGRRLQAHLDACPHCRAIQAELSGLHEAMGGMEVLPPAQLKEQIMAGLPPRRSGRVVYWKRWGAMAAALCLIALAAWRLPHSLYEKQVSAPSDLELGTIAGAGGDTSGESVAVNGAERDGLPAPASIQESDAGVAAYRDYGAAIPEDVAPTAGIMDRSTPAEDLPMDVDEAVVTESLPLDLSETVDADGLDLTPRLFTGRSELPAAKSAAPALGGEIAEFEQEDAMEAPELGPLSASVSISSLTVDPVYSVDASDTDVIVVPQAELPAQ